MKHGQNVDMSVRCPVGDDVRRAGHDQLTGASDTTGSAHERMVSQLSDPALDAFAQPRRGFGVMLQDEIEDAMNILSAWSRQTMIIAHPDRDAL
jgi:hypothetical protein